MTKKIHAAKGRKIRPVCYSVLAAFAFNGTAAADSRFADTPLYLQSKTTTTGASGIKPNVMLLIDDSGSMAETPEGRMAEGSSRNKLGITKNALKLVLNKYQNKINWGFQTLHNNNNADLPGYTDQWQTVSAQVDRLTAQNGTPTTRRYYETVKTVRDNTLYRCQQNFIVLMSDGDANTSCGYRQYPSFRDLNDPYFGSKQAGQCVDDRDGWYDSVWDQNDGLRFFSRQLFTDGLKKSGTDAAGKSWKGDAADPKDANGQSIYAKQIVETYTVGFGRGISQRGRNYLQRGGQSTSQSYYQADNAAELQTTFDNIFKSVETASQNNAPAPSTTGSVAPAPTSSGISGLAAFVRLHPATWSSQLHFYKINPNGSVNVNAATAQPSFANRKTLINTGSKVLWADNTLRNDDLSNADFGIAQGSAADNLEWKNALLPWITRSGTDSTIKASAASKRYSQPYRERTDKDQPANEVRNLGDILDGSVATAGGMVEGRSEFMAAAANDGMVHLFRSTAGSSPYDLKLSYIPAGMERDLSDGTTTTLGKVLKDTAHEKYGESVPHRYMVNGGFVMRQTAAGGGAKGQQVFMFGAMGQGGRGAYALNLGGQNRATGDATGLNNSDTAAWKNEVPLFETPKGAGNTLGYTVGTPQIGRVSIRRDSRPVSITQNVRYAGFLASGYRQNNAETALYVYDMLGQEAASGNVTGSAGTLIRKIEVSDGVGGLSSPTLVDTDFDGIVDAAYAGDYGGNMYRFDLRGQRPSEWKASRIFKGSPKQPITAAPAVSRRSANKYVVIFGTGSDIYQSDLDNTEQQAVYGIYDNLDTAAADASAAELQVQTTETKIQTDDSGKTKEYVFLSNNAVGSDKKGWRIALPGIGERVVVKPTMILRTAVVTTRSYSRTTVSGHTSSDVCVPNSETSTVSGSTTLLGINAENGGALTPRSARFLPDTVFKQNNGNVDGGNSSNGNGGNSNQTGAATPFANGLKLDGIVSFTLMDGQKTDNSPVTVDGDVGASGSDSALTDKPRVPNNRYFFTKNASALVGNDMSSFVITGPMPNIRRISWREIF